MDDSDPYSEEWIRRQINWPNVRSTDRNSLAKESSRKNEKNISIRSDSFDISISSEDDIEIEEEIKVVFEGSSTFHRFSVMPNTPFSSIFDQISKMKNVSTDRISMVMMPLNRDVSKFDSLISLKCFSACSIFHAFIADGNNNPLEGRKGTGNIEIKCVAVNKKILKYKMFESQPLDILMSYCARDLNKIKSNLKFVFDGEIIKPSDTCCSLGIEDQDMVEIYST